MKVKKEKKRILKSEVYLTNYLTLGEEFHLGAIFNPEKLQTLGLNRFGLRPEMKEGEIVIPSAVGPYTRANTKGKIVRSFPEEKIDITKRIRYIRKRDQRLIEFDRTFNVFKKELQHRYNIGLTLKSDANGDKVLFSPKLVFDNNDEDNMRNTHVINLFIEIFGSNGFDVYRTNLNPSYRNAPTFDKEILPSGHLNNANNFDELIEIIKRYVNQKEVNYLIERLELFKEYNPLIRESSKGFNQYFILIFEEKRIVVAESIKKGNATYFFNLDGYEDVIVKDKQTVISEKLMLKRFKHSDYWANAVRNFLNKY